MRHKHLPVSVTLTPAGHVLVRSMFESGIDIACYTRQRLSVRQATDICAITQSVSFHIPETWSLYHHGGHDHKPRVGMMPVVMWKIKLQEVSSNSIFLKLTGSNQNFCKLFFFTYRTFDVYHHFFSQISYFKIFTFKASCYFMN